VAKLFVFAYTVRRMHSLSFAVAENVDSVTASHYSKCKER
jgi:hypothetical protein